MALGLSSEVRVTTVLDSSAVLAILFREPAGDVVRARMPDAAISVVNYVEVITKLVDRDMSDARIEEVLASLEMTVEPFDAAQALAAGLLRRPTRAAGLSLGDRACLALALTLGAPVLTADRAWAGLEVGVPIEVVR